MNYIFIVCIIIAGIIETIRRLSADWKWFADITSKIPYFKAGCIVLSIIVILYAVINKVNIELDKKMFSLFVVLDHVKVVPGYSKKAILKIVNNHNYPIYQIIS